MEKGGRTGAGNGSRCRVQSRAAEDGGWRVVITSRWAAFRFRRGGGERVQDRGYMMTNSTGGGSIG